jgi:hypothetical protein
MLLLSFILLLIGLVCISALSVNNANRAFTDGQSEGIRQMQVEAVNRGYGEWRPVGNTVQFCWVCTTIVTKEGE